MFKARFGTTAFFLATGLMLAAPAANAAEFQRVNVDAHGLDLASDAGRAVLAQRIMHAVDNICGSSHSRSTWEQHNYAVCSQAARADAASQFDTLVAAAENARKVAGGGGNAAPVR